ncbi:MAG TPA: hypothetical protein VF981_11820 [Gemmatimonadaceae bacterium]
MALDAAKRATIEKWGVIALAGVFAWVVATQLLPSFRASEPAAPPHQQAESPAPERPETVATRSLQESLASLRGMMIPEGSEAGLDARETPHEPRYTAHELRDPFESLLPSAIRAAQAAPQPVMPGVPIDAGMGQTAVEPAVQFPEIAVQGMLWGGPVPVAVIDGGVYQVGDTVSGARITAIERAGVTMEYQGVTALLAVQRGGF